MLADRQWREVTALEMNLHAYNNKRTARQVIRKMLNEAQVKLTSTPFKTLGIDRLRALREVDRDEPDSKRACFQARTPSGA